MLHEARHRTAGLALAAVAAASLYAAPAHSQEPLPEDNAGADQYIEPVPDAGGDRRPGGDRDGRGGRGGRAQLPPGTRNALPAGEEGNTLDRLATDPAAGAPAGAAGQGSGEDGDSRDGDGDGDDEGSAASAGGDGDGDGDGAIGALVSAVTESDSSTLPLLLVGLGGLTLAGVAARRSRSS